MRLVEGSNIVSSMINLMGWLGIFIIVISIIWGIYKVKFKKGNGFSLMRKGFIGGVYIYSIAVLSEFYIYYDYFNVSNNTKTKVLTALCLLVSAGIINIISEK